MKCWRQQQLRVLPDALEMHGPDLDDVADLLAFENAVSTSSGHSSDVEQLGAVDHVVVCPCKLDS